MKAGKRWIALIAAGAISFALFSEAAMTGYAAEMQESGQTEDVFVEELSGESGQEEASEDELLEMDSADFESESNEILENTEVESDEFEDEEDDLVENDNGDVEEEEAQESSDVLNAGIVASGDCGADGDNVVWTLYSMALW